MTLGKGRKDEMKCSHVSAMDCKESGPTKVEIHAAEATEGGDKHSHQLGSVCMYLDFGWARVVRTRNPCTHHIYMAPARSQEGTIIHIYCMNLDLGCTDSMQSYMVHL